MEGHIVCKQNKYIYMDSGTTFVTYIKQEGNFSQTCMENYMCRKGKKTL